MGTDNIKHNTKWMQLPRSVLVGHDALLEVGNACNQLKLGGSAVIVVDVNTRKIAGNTVNEILTDSGYDTLIVEIGSATTDEVSKVQNNASEMGAGFMLGVGGGTVIDVAKLASTNMGIPFLSVPTTASHDGIASPRASIRDGAQSVSVEAQSPMGIVADTRIIAVSPPRLTISGCGDIISNYTAVKDWQLAHRLHNVYYSEYAAALSQMTAEIIMNASDSIKPTLEESARIIIKALVSSGVAMGIAGSSAPASGSEHKFSHALDMVAPKPALHGEQCGVGTIMMMYLHGGDWKHIKDTLDQIGAPTTADRLGIDEEHVIDALVRASEIRPERYTILGGGLTRDAAENLARVAQVIE